MLRTTARNTARAAIRGVASAAVARPAANDISRDLAPGQLLTGTGQGPFIELPSFKPIGSMNNLLNVKLPQRSALSVVSGAIIAMNGDLSGLSAAPRTLADTDYQILQSESAVSLVFGGKGRSNMANNYTVVETDRGEAWTVFDARSLVAWTGFDFSLEPTAVFGTQASVATRGKGRVVLNDGHKLVEVELGPNERFWAKPTAVVAASGPYTFKVLGNDSRLPELGVAWPRVPSYVGTAYSGAVNGAKKRWAALVKSMNAESTVEDVGRALARVRRLGANTVLFLKLHLVNRIFKKQIMVEFVGPSRILVNDSGRDGNRVFSKEQAQRVFSSNGY